jgi:hypothetical protein
MLVQITSAQSLHMWFRFYLWFRLFPYTAIYIKMIKETLYDLKNFLLILQIVLCAFGNALLIVDRYQRQIPEQGIPYEPMIPLALGYDITDSWIS